MIKIICIQINIINTSNKYTQLYKYITNYNIHNRLYTRVCVYIILSQNY